MQAARRPRPTPLHGCDLVAWTRHLGSIHVFIFGVEGCPSQWLPTGQG